MKENIINYIKNSREINEISSYFERIFRHNYESFRESGKDTMLVVRDAIFRKWLYSSLIPDTYLSPSYIINQICQNEIKGDYVVMLHIKPVKNKENLSFEHKYNFYSIKEHPVIKDLENLVEFCYPSKMIGDNIPYKIEDGAKIIEEITYRSGYYLEYLIALMHSLKLVKKMPSIGCTCITPSARFEDFKELSNEEKLIQIIDKSIEIAINKFNEEKMFISKLNRKKVLDMLDNGINADIYLEETEKSEGMFNEIFKYLQREEVEVLGEMEETEEGGMATYFSQVFFGIYIDMWFVSIFGYYLGIIQPVFSKPLNMKMLSVALTGVSDSMERLALLFEMNDEHDLTPLGKKIIAEFKENLKKEEFVNISNKQMVDILEGVRVEVEEFEKWCDEDIDEEYDDEDEIDDGSDINEEIREELLAFNDYLLVEKNLKESTVDKHGAKIGFYVYMFLDRDSNSKILYNGKILDEYISDFYLPYATSKTDIKDNLVAFKHYGEYMYHRGYISYKELDEIKDVCNNKNRYVAFYETYVDGEE